MCYIISSHLILCALVLLNGCSRPEKSSSLLRPQGPASKVLANYYVAIRDNDSARTFSLSTDQRASILRPRAAAYFKRCNDWPNHIFILGERVASNPDSQCFVRYADTVFYRVTGAKLATSLVDCEMIKEHGEWKVSECRIANSDSQ